MVSVTVPVQVLLKSDSMMKFIPCLPDGSSVRDKYIWDVVRHKFQNLSMLSSRPQPMVDSIPYTVMDENAGTCQVLFNVDILRIVLKQALSYDFTLPYNVVQDTQAEGRRNLKMLISMSCTCHLWRTLLLAKTAPLGGWMLEAIARVFVIGEGTIPHVGRYIAADQQQLPPHMHHECVNVIQLMLEIHTGRQLRRLKDAHMSLALHCATQFSANQRLAFNEDMSDALKQGKTRMFTAPCRLAFVTQTALVMAATSTAGSSILAVVRHEVVGAHPHRVSTAAPPNSIPLHLVLYSHANMMYTPAHEPVCTCIGKVILTNPFQDTTRPDNPECTLTLDRPHTICISECARMVAIACTAKQPYNVSMLFTVDISLGSSEVNRGRCLANPVLMRPHDATHCHVQSMWFVHMGNNILHLMVVFSSGFSAPGDLNFFQDSASESGPLSFVLSRHELSPQHTWTQLDFYGPFDGRVVGLSASTIGKTVALTTCKTDAAVSVHIWSDYCGKPYELSDAVNVNQWPARVGWSIVAVAISTGAETLAIVKQNDMTDESSILELWRCNSNDECGFSFIVRCDLSDYVQMPPAFDNLVKHTIDLTFSPCGRFMLLVSGSQRFGSTQTQISTLDIADLYKEYIDRRLEHNIWRERPAGLNVLHRGTVMDPLCSRQTCIRIVCWKSDCMWLGLGKGAVCLDHTMPFDSLASALRESGAFV
jgi:hypothetical protein